MDDDTLMRLFQQGRDDAYEQLVRRWDGPMLNFFYRMMGDADMAEDLRQDLFVRLYTRRDTFRGNGTFRAWLYSIASNLARTHLRRSKQWARTRELDADDESAAPLPETPAAGPTAADQVHRSESARLARQLLDTLSPDEREALTLRFYEGLKYGEIAAALDLPEPTVKSRIYRAIDRLRGAVVERGLTAAEWL